jgi:hypothetical protein
VTTTTTPTRQPIKILTSFHYFQREDMTALHAATSGGMIMGDSGAFTADTKGTPIAYPAYRAWLRRFKHLLFCYPCLDVIGDPEATAAAHTRMRGDGLDPLPVYHYGSPLRHLKAFLDAGERYIALGGMVGSYGADTKRWIITCFKTAGPYGAVFHGFGRTRFDDLADFPWYSVDSSSFASGARYGELRLFHAGRFISLRRNEPRSLYAHGRLLRAHGADPAAVDNRNTGGRPLAYTCGVLAWRRAEEWMRARHGPVKGVRPGDPDGPHLFFADSQIRNLHLLTDVIHTHPGPYLTPTTGNYQ